MRVILKDINGQDHSIETADMALASVWIQSWLPTIMDSMRQTHYPWQIMIWPTTDSEDSWIKQPMERRQMSPHMAIFINEESCRKLSDVFAEMADAFHRHMTPTE